MKRRNPSKSTRNGAAAPLGKGVPTGGGHVAPWPAQFGGASSAWPIVLALAIIAMVAAVAYCNSFSGPFIFDDRPWVMENPNIWHFWPIWQLLVPSHATLVGGRPVLSFTLAINYALGGMNVWGYHAVNLAIHILAAWTLFGITRRTLSLPRLRERFGSAAVPLALTAATLWMIHPLQTESVTYIIQRTEALMGLFYLLVLYCVIRGATSNRSNSWYVAAVVSCLLGMATKEVMVTAPVIVLLYDRTFLTGSLRDAWRQRHGLYLALAATWSVVILLLISTGFYGGTAGFAVQKFNWWSYLLTQPGVIVHYLRLTFWPTQLCLDYGWPAARSLDEMFLPGMLVTALLVLTIWALVKRPQWGFLGAWFFVILAPTSSLVPIKDAAFEHRMYLSLASVAAGAVMGGWVAGQWLVGRGKISPTALQVIGGALALFVGVVLGNLTFQRNAVYQSKVSIWEDAAAKAPQNERAQYILGMALAGCRRTDEALFHFHRALEIKPDCIDAHNNLGAFLAECGQSDEALVHLRKAIELGPQAEAFNNLGLVLAGRGQLSEAVVEYQKALEIKPDFIEAHNNLGNALASCGRMDDAVAHFRKALEIKPDCAEAHYNFGLVLARGGRIDEAMTHYRQALAIQPEYVQARNNLGVALIGRGRLDEAIAEFEAALKTKPGYAEAHNNLGLALLRRGRRDEAVAHFRKALEVKADFVEARKNLANALGQDGAAK
jgi:protein O-mannosyl-transferase